MATTTSQRSDSAAGDDANSPLDGELTDSSVVDDRPTKSPNCKTQIALSLLETYRDDSSKPLTKRARHFEEYCIRRSNRFHRKPRCRIFRCRFRSFNWLANLFSGLFLIIHSLYGLIMFERPSLSSSKDHNITYLKDRQLYEDRWETLKRTDKGHYQAAVVLTASLFCVISLSFAKASAFKMEKLRTVAEYTRMAIGASAVSFIASQLVSDLLKKYGFDEIE
ncbi:hypothetical protein CARUB_v10007279mg [Capsella rubella]|uniref:Uncharacterized protein n=1 Tax=Capsella rubella TaxID=81985 RepID=R0FAF1_9BRAS|nr:hypothetical protein CARUB_v10007279mg [Capsella rubella]